MCLDGYDIGIPSSAIAYVNPICPDHGDPEGLLPLTQEEEEAGPEDRG